VVGRVVGTRKRRAQLVSLRGGAKFEVTPLNVLYFVYDLRVDNNNNNKTSVSKLGSVSFNTTLVTPEPNIFSI